MGGRVGFGAGGHHGYVELVGVMASSLLLLGTLACGSPNTPRAAPRQDSSREFAPPSFTLSVDDVPVGQLHHVVNEFVTTKLMDSITVEAVMNLLEKVSAE